MKKILFAVVLVLVTCGAALSDSVYVGGKSDHDDGAMGLIDGLKIEILDNAKGKTWTNIQQVKNRIELKLLKNNLLSEMKVSTYNYPSIYINVSSTRLDGGGAFGGRVSISIGHYGKVNKKINTKFNTETGRYIERFDHEVSYYVYHEYYSTGVSFTGGGGADANSIVLNFVDQKLDEIIIKILKAQKLDSIKKYNQIRSTIQ